MSDYSCYEFVIAGNGLETKRYAIAESMDNACKKIMDELEYYEKITSCKRLGVAIT